MWLIQSFQMIQLGLKMLNQHVELLKIREQKNQDKHSLGSNVRPNYKHLSEVRTELTIWLQKKVAAKERDQIKSCNSGRHTNQITESLLSIKELNLEVKYQT